MRTVSVPLYLATQIESYLSTATGERSKTLKGLGNELAVLLDAVPHYSAGLAPLRELATAGGRPIVVFDIESTGKNPTTDRIIEIALVKVYPLPTYGLAGASMNDGIERKAFLVDPCCKIPAEASAVHGITDEQVKGLPCFEDVSAELVAFIEGCDVAGFNSNAYDVVMLSEELNACGYTWPFIGMRQYDASTIYRKEQPRTLAAAVEHYTGEPLQDAHSAFHDTEATALLLAAQLEGNGECGKLMPDDLHTYCQHNPEQLDVAGKLVRGSDGVARYNFGKNVGIAVVHDRSYAMWMLRNDFPANTKMHLRAILGV